MFFSLPDMHLYHSEGFSCYIWGGGGAVAPPGPRARQGGDTRVDRPESLQGGHGPDGQESPGVHTGWNRTVTTLQGVPDSRDSCTQPTLPAHQTQRPAQGGHSVSLS